MHSAAEYLSELSHRLDGWRSDDTPRAADSDNYSALFARVREGDSIAFDALVLALVGPLTAYARRLTGSLDAAQDLVQDVFAHVWENRTTLFVRGGVRSYLYTALRNRALDIRKRERFEAVGWSEQEGRPSPGVAHPSYAADAALYRREIADRVAAALNALSPRVRETALLRWHDGLSRPEIAAIMGVAVPTINNQLTTAARVVRALLADLRVDM